MNTFRVQMAHTAEHDLRHEIEDVKSAYLESKMDPKMPVYINIPGQPAPPGYAARLIKSLYGTKQAGHNWHATIVPLLKKWGFKQSPADPCCFIHQTNKNDYCVLCLFVDDFSITSTRKSTKSRDLFFKSCVLHTRLRWLMTATTTSASAAVDWHPTPCFLIKSPT